MFHKPQPATIRFSCAPADEGVIAAPYAAKAYLPDWFRKLPAVDATVESPTNTGLTVKRCLPFLDAMTTGWIIPLAATVRMVIAEGGTRVETGWDFDRTLVSNHAMHQVKGNPMGQRPPCKFINFWTITTPPGWSCLFVNPLNRPNPVFEVVAGVVDTDTYRSPIHFPFFATGEDGMYTIEKGSPLVQVIPFKRDTTALAADIGAERPEEAETRKKILRNTQASPGWYRLFARAGR
ncbi:MAG: hypothetical protein JXQ79_06775 [Rhodobacteraceae bacterium]|nr:hypothetical protein [Paracoccaceae bacterium]